MGADAARRAFTEAEADGKIDIVLSVGWAGALVENLIPGAAYVASSVVDAGTGERFELACGARDTVLVTSAHVAQEVEKRRLAEAYGAKLVDMESATILRLAQMRDIPVICMKAVSDDVGETLPDFNAFIDAEGQMRMMAFIRHVLVRPHYWGGLIRLRRASSDGAHSLASQVATFLSGPKDVEHVNRTGNVDW
jgi:adenosylhomocysteine nucleosidase